VATDSVDNVYVADTNNNLFRKITPSGNVGTLSGIRAGQGVVTDKADNLYAAAYVTIQKVTPAGVTTTFAGAAPSLSVGGYTGSLPGFLFLNRGMAIAPNNILYLSEVDGIIKIVLP
jgi:hypothetical protein